MTNVESYNDKRLKIATSRIKERLLKYCILNASIVNTIDMLWQIFEIIEPF